MKKLLTLSTILALSLSAAANAQEYNHGNHNDNQVLFGTNNTMTVSCGSLSLANCINPVSLDQLTENKCDTLVSPNQDTGAVAWGSAYYHTVQSYGVDVISAIDLNNGIGVNNFDITIIYSCSALFHPAQLMKI